MKKAYKNKIISIGQIIFLFVCLLLFNSSCGLDVYYVVESPNYTIHFPYYDSEYDSCYFSFKTNENNDNTEVSNFLGTAVYYKIYKSYSKMNSEVGSINGYISSTDNKANAAPRMTTTYNYQLLKAEKATSGILIEHDDSGDLEVKIRLTDLITSDGSISEGYEADISVEGKSLGKPLRNEDNLNFNFASYRTDENSAIPEEGDCDVQDPPTSSDSDDDNKWYVPMYAVGVALNADDYTNTLSVPLYLGCVTIKDNDEYN